MNFREAFGETMSGFNQEMYSDEIREIRTFYDILNDHFVGHITEDSRDQVFPESPFAKFKKYLIKSLEEKGLIDVKPEDYVAFHYTQGSSPDHTRIRDFDLDGDYIRIKFKEFAITQYPELFEIED